MKENHEVYEVTGYSDGLWCIVHRASERIVKWYPTVAWKTVFGDRDEADELARQMNAAGVDAVDLYT